MDPIEIIGLIILLLAMFSPILKRIFKKRDQKKHPDYYAKQKQQREAQERQMMEEIAAAIPAEPAPLPPTRQPLSKADKWVFESSEIVSERMQRKRDDAYAFYEQEMSRARRLVMRPGARRDMILLHEVLSPPISLR